MKLYPIALAVALSVASTASAQVYEFGCVVQAEVPLADPTIELEIDTDDLRAALGDVVPAPPLHVVVTDADTGDELPSAVSELSGAKLVVAWAAAGAMATGDERAFRVALAGGERPAPALGAGELAIEREGSSLLISTGLARVTHDLNRGGTITLIDYGPGRALPLTMNDRVWSKDWGAFYLRGDTDAKVSVVRTGTWRADVEIDARYMRGDTWAPGEPAAQYRFTYRAGSPFVDVSMESRQAGAEVWQQLHVLELHHTDDYFTHRALGEPLESGELTHPSQTASLQGRPWGAVLNEQDAIGLVGWPLYGIHDGLGKYGIYVHGPWLNDVALGQSASSAIYIGPSGGSPEALAEMMRAPRPGYSIRQEHPRPQAMVAALLQQVDRLPQAGRTGDLAAAASYFTLAASDAASRGDLRECADAMSSAEVLMAAAPAATDPLIDADADEVLIHAGELLLTLNRDGVSRLARPAAGDEFVARDGGPLWCARFRHAETGEVTDVAPKTSLPEWEAKGDLARLVWRDVDLPYEPDAVDVRVTIQCEPGSSLSKWRIGATNRSESWGLWSVDFPRIGGIHTGPDTTLTVPRRWGTELRGADAAGGFAGEYPSAWMNMQFVSCSRGQSGLYLASHDPDAQIKTFAMRPGEGGLDFATTLYPEAMGLPGRAYEMPFDAVIGVNDGGWYEAAKIYRAWATREAPWCANGPLAARDDVPQWFKDCALSLRPGGAPESVARTLASLHAAFKMPAVVHWYEWHQIPFDNNYPEYFPTKPGFAEAVSDALQIGLRVMPYINGRLWDSDTASWTAKRAADSVCIDANGEPQLEHWRDQNHGVMCPATPLWQQTMADTAATLASEYGCAGVYLDQIGAARGLLCFGDGHGHEPGGAASWVAGEQQLLADVRRVAREAQPDFIMTTEDNAEPYMGQLDGYLMCNAEGPGLVPLFPAVYGGYTLTFGRTGQLNDELTFAMQHGQAFVFGSIMGRVSSDAITAPEHAEKLDFLKRLAQARYEYREFLGMGEMLHPPTLVGDIPELEAVFASKYRGPVRMSAVQSSAWRAPDGRVGNFLVNISRETQSFGIVLDGEEERIRLAPWEVRALLRHAD